MAQIRERVPEADLELRRLDLANLDSVRDFAKSFLDDHGSLDVLVNNAGIMTPPYAKTADGFEMQIGTNHLGHFALTGRLLPALARSEAPRVVTVSSVAHWFGRIRFHDLSWEKGYSRWAAYAQSKLANLLFAKEFARRVGDDAAGKVLSVACHPGYASTNLQAGGARLTGSGFKEWFMNSANSHLAQSASMGAYPTVTAATSEELSGGDFVGPDGMLELHGFPKKRTPAKRAEDREVAARLWDLSVELTGVAFEG